MPNPVQQSNNFNSQHVIPENERVAYGYRDAGRGVSFDESGRPIGQPSREIIVVRSPAEDPHLKRVIDIAKSDMAKMTSVEQKVEYLNKFVGKVLKENDPLKNEAIMDFISGGSDHAGKEISLGQLIEARSGVCRHRSLLFKVLADEVGIPAARVRGNYIGPDGQGGHAWNEVSLPNGKKILVDPMHDFVGEMGHPKVRHYYDVNDQPLYEDPAKAPIAAKVTPINEPVAKPAGAIPAHPNKPFDPMNVIADDSIWHKASLAGGEPVIRTSIVNMSEVQIQALESEFERHGFKAYRHHSETLGPVLRLEGPDAARFESWQRPLAEWRKENIPGFAKPSMRNPIGEAPWFNVNDSQGASAKYVDINSLSLAERHQLITSLEAQNIPFEVKHSSLNGGTDVIAIKGQEHIDRVARFQERSPLASAGASHPSVRIAGESWEKRVDVGRVDQPDLPEPKKPFWKSQKKWDAEQHQAQLQRSAYDYQRVVEVPADKYSVAELKKIQSNIEAQNPGVNVHFDDHPNYNKPVRRIVVSGHADDLAKFDAWREDVKPNLRPVGPVQASPGLIDPVERVKPSTPHVAEPGVTPRKDFDPSRPAQMPVWDAQRPVGSPQQPGGGLHAVNSAPAHTPFDPSKRANMAAWGHENQGGVTPGKPVTMPGVVMGAAAPAPNVQPPVAQPYVEAPTTPPATPVPQKPAAPAPVNGSPAAPPQTPPAPVTPPVAPLKVEAPALEAAEALKIEDTPAAPDSKKAGQWRVTNPDGSHKEVTPPVAPSDLKPDGHQAPVLEMKPSAPLPVESPGMWSKVTGGLSKAGNALGHGLSVMSVVQGGFGAVEAAQKGDGVGVVTNTANVALNGASLSNLTPKLLENSPSFLKASVGGLVKRAPLIGTIVAAAELMNSEGEWQHTNADGTVDLGEKGDKAVLVASQTVAGLAAKSAIGIPIAVGIHVIGNAAIEERKAERELDKVIADGARAKEIKLSPETIKLNADANMPDIRRYLHVNTMLMTNKDLARELRDDHIVGGPLKREADGRLSNTPENRRILQKPENLAEYQNALESFRDKNVALREQNRSESWLGRVFMDGEEKFAAFNKAKANVADAEGTLKELSKYRGEMDVYTKDRAKIDAQIAAENRARIQQETRGNIAQVQKDLHVEAAKPGRLDPTTKDSIGQLIAKAQATEDYKVTGAKGDGVYGKNTAKALQAMADHGEVPQATVDAIKNLHKNGQLQYTKTLPEAAAPKVEVERTPSPAEVAEVETPPVEVKGNTTKVAVHPAAMPEKLAPVIADPVINGKPDGVPGSSHWDERITDRYYGAARKTDADLSGTFQLASAKPLDNSLTNDLTYDRTVSNKANGLGMG